MQNRWRQCGERGCNRRMGRFLEPALLLLLEQSSAHGYTLLSRMAEFELDFLAPTVVYRALRQMENKSWVTSTWDEEETQGPPRRVYAITPVGREILRCCISQLRSSQQIIEYFVAMHNELTPGTSQDIKKSSKPISIRIKEDRMRIVIPAEGTDLNAATSAVFGRCTNFIFVDPETLDFEVLENPAVSAPGGAGVQAAQTVLQKQVKAVVAPSLGPNAFRVIEAAGVKTYYLKPGTVKDNVQAFKTGELQSLESPGPDHVGLGRGMRRGPR